MHEIGHDFGLAHSGGLDGHTLIILATWETHVSTTTNVLCASTLPKLGNLVGTIRIKSSSIHAMVPQLSILLELPTFLQTQTIFQ